MTFRQLPWLNIKGRWGRSLALFLFALFLSCATCGASLVLLSVRNGLRSLELRLGADIIVTPETAYVKKGMENILLYGNRSSFYMPKMRLADVAAIPGVDRLSAQLFLATLSSGCCSVGLQIIGFEPESDFTVQPWLSKDFSGTLSEGDVIVGSKIAVPSSRTLRFFGCDCRIVAQLRDTGTGLDNAVYTSTETIRKLLAASMDLGVNDKLAGNPDKLVSSIMVKVKDGYDVNDVARQIDRKVKQVKAVKTKSMTSDIAGSLSAVARIVALLIAFVWLLCVALMLLVFSMVMAERIKEFAVLRAAGASQGTLAVLVLSEAVIVTAAGACAGIVLVCLCLFPFHTMLEETLHVPFLLPSAPLSLLVMFGSLVVTVIAGAVASSLSAFRISRLDTGMILRKGN